MEQEKITLDKCLETVKSLNEGILIDGKPQTEGFLLQKARYLYLINRLDLLKDIPVLVDLIKYERENYKK